MSFLCISPFLYSCLHPLSFAFHFQMSEKYNLIMNFFIFIIFSVSSLPSSLNVQVCLKSRRLSSLRSSLCELRQRCVYWCTHLEPEAVRLTQYILWHSIFSNEQENSIAPLYNRLCTQFSNFWCQTTNRSKPKTAVIEPVAIGVLLYYVDCLAPFTLFTNIRLIPEPAV